MPPLQADGLGDLVTTTLRDLGRNRWTDIASTLQEYVAMKQILQAKRAAFQSGYGIQFNLMRTTSGAADHVGLFEIDNVNVGDIMITGNIPWRHARTNYAIERREISMNRTPARIVNLLQTRRVDAMIALALELETGWWGVPASGTTADPFGVDYWLVKNATTGFNGGNHANFSGGPAGIDRDITDNARFKNYTFQYTNITKPDLVRKWREAATKTKFTPAVDNPSYDTGTDYGYYTNYDVIGPLEEALEGQNDNLGPDIASMDGRLVFRRVPVTWVPQLDSDAQDPIYGLNWSVIKPVFLTGEYLRETGPMQASNQHNVLQVHIDLTYNYVCYDPRKCFIGNKA